MSENGLVDPETETTDLKIQAPDSLRTEERSAGDERLFAWRANYLGRKRSPYKKIAGAGAWLGAAGLAGILGAFVLKSRDFDLSASHELLPLGVGFAAAALSGWGALILLLKLVPLLALLLIPGH